MIAALSPLLSWVVVGMVLFISVAVYAAVVAGGRADDWAEQFFADDRQRAKADSVIPIVRVFGGVYDHEARGDFDWTLDHDPTIDHGRCEVCNALLRRALVRLADRPMSPRDADELMVAIREELES